MTNNPPVVSPQLYLARKWRVLVRARRLVTWTLVALVLVGAVLYESSTSRLQGLMFSHLARGATFRVEAGENPQLRFPSSGPYNQRLGYVDLPRFQQRLRENGFELVSQTRTSGTFTTLVDLGLNPIYSEKSSAGLTLHDRDGRVFYQTQHPQRVFRSFEDIPRLMVDTLLFIENRELLARASPYHNPAVEWDRLIRGAISLAINEVSDDEQKVAGGSTLATQIEKYRHSPEGRTHSGHDKLRQMLSASLRAYRDGPDTTQIRRRLVLDYINTVPLAAAPGFGEVHGVGDGLYAWFGAELDHVSTLLRGLALSNQELAVARATAYKQVLGLFLAQRRPAYYLSGDGTALNELADTYLALLFDAGVVGHELLYYAKSARLTLSKHQSTKQKTQFLQRKAASGLRTRLLNTLGVPSLYTLDRLDLSVDTTLDSRLQTAVTQHLVALRDPQEAKKRGLYGPRLLSEKDDLGKIIYSFTLYERGRDANYVRVQADNFDQPFDINDGVKLDLGSTAKLRTLVSYLNIIAKTFHQLAPLPRSDLEARTVDANDRLSQWVKSYLLEHAQASLSEVLEAALERVYSASPHERFYTGGGVHTFVNFDPLDDAKEMTVREAMHNSVNLVFIRLMRDIVRFYMYQTPGSTAKLLEDTKDERRAAYLARFADREGQQFMRRFFNKYDGLDPAPAFKMLLGRDAGRPARAASIHRYLFPDAGFSEFAGDMLSVYLEAGLSEQDLRELYERAAERGYSLADRGFLTHVHPLELWVAKHVIAHRGASLEQVLVQGSDARQQVYQWLQSTRHKNAQDRRIRDLLELEAFLEIHRQWAKMGYPFDALVPSYASALGTSGDRPAALAQLMGIIVNDGVLLPSVRFERLHFAENTPYETHMRRRLEPSERVLDAEVAAAVRRVLQGVVAKGTARRLAHTFRGESGEELIVGGKTGTGDHRRDTYSAGGRLLRSEVVNRTATFVFFIDERYFGTVTAYVPGKAAASFGFTSGLPVQILKSMGALLNSEINRRSGQLTQAAADLPLRSD